MARFPGAFTGRINKPSLPRSNTFNGPPRSKPSRRHQSSGKIVWRFSVKVMVVAFMVIIHYLKPAVCQGFRKIYLQKLTLHFVQCLRKTCGLFRQTLQLQMKNEKHRRATMQVVLVIHHSLVGHPFARNRLADNSSRWLLLQAHAPLPTASHEMFDALQSIPPSVAASLRLGIAVAAPPCANSPFNKDKSC